MINRRLQISMPADLLKEPILYRLVKDFDLVPSVRKADVRDQIAWMTIELQAKTGDQIARGMAYLTSLGATVKSLEGDFIEG